MRGNLFAMDPSVVPHKLDVLRGHCEDEKRDYDSIERRSSVFRLIAHRHGQVPGGRGRIRQAGHRQGLVLEPLDRRARRLDYQVLEKVGPSSLSSGPPIKNQCSRDISGAFGPPNGSPVAALAGAGRSDRDRVAWREPVR